MVALLPERKRQFAKPPPDAIRLDVREVLTVYTRCALVGAALGKRMGLRLLPAGAVAGWDLHPLESAAFARRTPRTDFRPDDLCAAEPPRPPRRLVKSAPHVLRLMIVSCGLNGGRDCNELSAQPSASRIGLETSIPHQAESRRRNPEGKVHRDRRSSRGEDPRCATRH